MGLSGTAVGLIIVGVLVVGFGVLSAINYRRDDL